MSEGSRDVALSFTLAEPDPRQGYTPAPLPVSPCLRERRPKPDGTYFIHPWDEAMAARSDLFENCDEKGNPDPRAWQGRLPGYGGPPPLTPPIQAAVPVAPLASFAEYQNIQASQVLAPPALAFDTQQLQSYQNTGVLTPQVAATSSAPVYSPPPVSKQT